MRAAASAPPTLSAMRRRRELSANEDMTWDDSFVCTKRARSDRAYLPIRGMDDGQPRGTAAPIEEAFTDFKRVIYMTATARSPLSRRSRKTHRCGAAQRGSRDRGERDRRGPVELLVAPRERR